MKQKMIATCLAAMLGFSLCPPTAFATQTDSTETPAPPPVPFFASGRG